MNNAKVEIVRFTEDQWDGTVQATVRINGVTAITEEFMSEAGLREALDLTETEGDQ